MADCACLCQAALFACSRPDRSSSAVQALISDGAIRIKFWLRLSEIHHTSNHSDFYKHSIALEAALLKELEDEQRRKRRLGGEADADAGAPSTGCLPACTSAPPPLANLRGARLIFIAGPGIRNVAFYNKQTRQVLAVEQSHLQVIWMSSFGAGTVRPSPYTHSAPMSDDAQWARLGQHVAINVDMHADLSTQQCFDRSVHAGGMALRLLAAPGMPAPINLNGGLCV